MSTLHKVLLGVAAVVIAVFAVYFINKAIGSGSNDASADNTQQSQATQAEIDDTQQQVDNYVEEVKQTPADALALRGLGDSYIQLGTLQNEANKINEALASYKGGVDAYRKSLAVKEDSDVRTDLGWAYFQLNMYTVAERELQRAVTIAPTNQRAWLTLGYLYITMTQNTDQSRTSDAQNAFQQCYNLSPNSDQGKEAKQRLDDIAQLASGTSTPGTSTSGSSTTDSSASGLPPGHP